MPGELVGQSMATRDPMRFMRLRNILIEIGVEREGMSLHSTWPDGIPGIIALVQQLTVVKPPPSRPVLIRATAILLAAIERLDRLEMEGVA